MSAPTRVALLGFSNFERNALAACLRLTVAREPCYELVTDVEQAALLVADADHAPSFQLVEVTERLEDTVFIGAEPPEGNAVCAGVAGHRGRGRPPQARRAVVGEERGERACWAPPQREGRGRHR
jgi:hypothetical protein